MEIKETPPAHLPEEIWTQQMPHITSYHINTQIYRLGIRISCLVLIKFETRRNAPSQTGHHLSLVTRLFSRDETKSMSSLIKYQTRRNFPSQTEHHLSLITRWDRAIWVSRLFLEKIETTRDCLLSVGSNTHAQYWEISSQGNGKISFATTRLLFP